MHTFLRGDLDTPYRLATKMSQHRLQKSLPKCRLMLRLFDGRIQESMGLPIERSEYRYWRPDLGPRLVVAALAPWQSPDMRVYFVSNVDAADIRDVLAQCQPETTLFIVASEPFTTEETLTNARSARAWLSDALGDAEIERLRGGDSQCTGGVAVWSVPRVFLLSMIGLGDAFLSGRPLGCRWPWLSALIAFSLF